MKLHEDKTLFRQAIQATSDRMGILPIYVEKDYWVTYALHAVFSSKDGNDIVFKGGTALSKCFGLIERFSEDIDLVILKTGEETGNYLKNKIKNVNALVSSILPEVKVDGITHKVGMTRKTAHTYSKEFTGEFGQIRDTIIVEATWLGQSEPYVERDVSSFVYDMMVASSQEKMALEYGLEPFTVRVLDPKRTFCEKIMSLVRFSYSENPISDLKLKVRHIYDLHRLLMNEEYSRYFDTTDFDEMLLKVANSDVESFKNNNDWLTHHPTEALFFKDLENLWAELLPVYTGEFKNIVYGELPTVDDVLNSLNRIKTRLSSVEWNIELDKDN